jgi:hypothetical protein
MELWCCSDVIYARMESLVKRGLLLARIEALEWVFFLTVDEAQGEAVLWWVGRPTEETERPALKPVWVQLWLM